jgi:hypothetical protein
MAHTGKHTEKPAKRRELYNMEPSAQMKTGFNYVGRRDSSSSVESNESDEQTREREAMMLTRRGAACGEELLRHHPCPSGL